MVSKQNRHWTFDPRILFTPVLDNILMVIKLEHGNVYQLIATTTRNQNFCPNIFFAMSRWRNGPGELKGIEFFEATHQYTWLQMLGEGWDGHITSVLEQLKMATNGQKCSSQSLRQVSALENSRQKIWAQNTLKVWSKFHYCGIPGPHTTTQWTLFSFSRPKYYLLTTHSLVLPNSYRFTILLKNFSIFTGKKIFAELFT